MSETQFIRMHLLVKSFYNMEYVDRLWLLSRLTADLDKNIKPYKKPKPKKKGVNNYVRRKYKK